MKYAQAYIVLLCVIIFLAPSNLFLKFFESTAYVNGIFVDYLIPKLYLSDIPILLILFLWGVEKFHHLRKISLNLKKTWPLVALGLLLIVRQFFAPHPLAAFWYLFKLGEMIALGFFLTHHRQLLAKRPVLMTIVATLIFQTLLALYQYADQSSLFGYWFLGEPNLSNPIGLARMTFNGVEKVLPYGTTAHPNILGGVLVMYLLLFSTSIKKEKLGTLKYPLIAIALLGAVALYLIHSLSAWLALMVGLVLIVRRPQISQRLLLIASGLTLLISPFIISSFTQFQPTNQSLVRREYLNQAAWNMFTENPLFGIGVNNFTARVEEHTLNNEVVRFIQPVHHVGLLWLAETGMIGLLILALAMYFFREKVAVKPFVILLPLLALDHYLLTNQSGLIVLVLMTTLITNQRKNDYSISD